MNLLIFNKQYQIFRDVWRMNWIIHRLEILTRMHHKCDNIDVPHCGRKVKRWWTRTDGRCYDTMNFPWDSMRLHFFSPHYCRSNDARQTNFCVFISMTLIFFLNFVFCVNESNRHENNASVENFTENKTWWSHKKTKIKFSFSSFRCVLVHIIVQLWFFTVAAQRNIHSEKSVVQPSKTIMEKVFRC